MAAINESSVMRLAVQKLFAIKIAHVTSCSPHSRRISFFACACQRRREEKSLKQAEGEFRTYEIPGLKGRQERKRFQRRRKEVPPPRYKQMRTDQDWTNVWPSAASFKWSVVPLPVRQGVAEKTTENDGVVPGKYANAELMKPPNFLHLTPDHIKKQCQAIKKFCTDWPKGLKKVDSHFPVTVTTSDYCFASTTIRDPRARMVSVQVPLSRLELDYHARDKLLRLIGDRYNPSTDMITITTDRCPVRKQNLDYAMYLLTAVYFESWKKEPWEDEKTEADMEKYFWNQSQSCKSIVSLLQRVKKIDQSKAGDTSTTKLSYLPDDLTEEKIVDLEPVKDYKDAVDEIINEGENYDSLMRYKNSVKKMLNIKSS